MADQPKLNNQAPLPGLKSKRPPSDKNAQIDRIQDIDDNQFYLPSATVP